MYGESRERSERDREMQVGTGGGRERQGETERGRERQRETGRDREGQSETERDRERQRETESGREGVRIYLEGLGRTQHEINLTECCMHIMHIITTDGTNPLGRWDRRRE